MSILLETSGIMTTVQDLGRNGFRAFGVNPNGAMDNIAVRLINILLGNDENEAVIELHFPCPKLRFEQDAIIALGGGDCARGRRNEVHSDFAEWQLGHGNSDGAGWHAGAGFPE